MGDGDEGDGAAAKWMGECTTVQVLEVVRAEQLFNFMGEDLCMGLREKVEDMHGSRRVSR